MADNQCSLHAYVLMTNQVHLLLTPRRADAVPRLIILLGRRYVQYINPTYKRNGTPWDSRYKSSLVQADIYLLAIQRYTQSGPRGNADDPAHTVTSYRANGLGQVDCRLTPRSVYLALGSSDERRQAAYGALFRHQLDKAAIDDTMFRQPARIRA